MRVLIQRVKEAQVCVNQEIVAGIGQGLALLVGIGKGDNLEEVRYMAKKVANLRIFEDNQGKMNKSVKEISGKVLSMPQFTLYADTRKGNRPGFDLSAEPQVAKEYWLKFNEAIRDNEVSVEEGIFGAHMEVSLTNDGPVTIWLDSDGKKQG